jgi:hypothetical protein
LDVLIENELRGGVYDFKFNGITTTTISGHDWLDTLNVPARLGCNILILLGWAALFWVLTDIGLYYQTAPRRRSAPKT